MSNQPITAHYAGTIYLFPHQREALVMANVDDDVARDLFRAVCGSNGRITLSHMQLLDLADWADAAAAKINRQGGNGKALRDLADAARAEGRQILGMEPVR